MAADPFYQYRPDGFALPPSSVMQIYPEDNVSSGVPGATKPSANQLGFIEVYFVGGTGITLDPADVLEDLSTNTTWSIEFDVASSAFDGNFSFVSDGGLFDNDPQTYYRLPIIKGGNLVCFGGSFRETIVCVNGEPIVQLVKIS